MKYTFSGEEKKKLKRIVALKDFGDVKKGDLGGWIESEENLSQEGNCWVYDNSVACQDSLVKDSALVMGDSWVGGFSIICDSATLDNASVFDSAVICDKALLKDGVFVKGNALIGGTSALRGKIDVSGFTKILSSLISGQAIISGDAQILNSRIIYTGEEPLTFRKSSFNDAEIFRKEDYMVFEGSEGIQNAFRSRRVDFRGLPVWLISHSEIYLSFSIDWYLKSGKDLSISEEVEEVKKRTLNW